MTTPQLSDHIPPLATVYDAIAVALLMALLAAIAAAAFRLRAVPFALAAFAAVIGLWLLAS